MSLSIRQIRAFEAVADARSFTEAAKRLNLTQSAVSMLVRQLETELGLALFVRGGRGVTLTEFGAEARPTLAGILEDLATVRDAAAGITALRRGHLRLALPQILGAAWLPDTLARFRAAHPGVRIGVIDTIGDRVVEAVAANEAEIGIGPERTLPPGVVAEEIWQVPMSIVFARSSPFAGRPGAPTEGELGRAGWIHYSDEFSLLLEKTLLRGNGPEGREGLRVRGLITALSLLGQSRFVTAAPAYAEIFAPVFGLAFRRMPGVQSLRRFMVYRRDGHPPSPAAAAFVSLAYESPPVAGEPDADRVNDGPGPGSGRARPADQ